jgi:ABC-type lipoprotein export system ATPase subunit
MTPAEPQPHAGGQATAQAGPTQQKLRGLDVVQLKGLKDVSLDFSHTPLTAIMGSNCSGKTTVLHALAAAYKPLKANDLDHRFSRFFRPNTDALWKESDFSIRYSHRIGNVQYADLSQRYTKATDRWSPRYEKRPARSTRFISIGESVPDIDAMNLNSMVHYQKTEAIDAVSIAVRNMAGQVLNRDYETLYNVTYDYRGMLSIGVRTPTAIYSGLSMSSGEQRVFRIAHALLSAPRYALILVDEIDLFLHQDALKRLLKKLQTHCAEKHIQLIFTTHFPPVAEMYDEMCIYSLNRVPAKTVVWRGYSYEAMRHITGEQERPILCYVEDDVAEQIVARVATELRIRRFVELGKFGPAANAFSLCAGLYLSNHGTEHVLAVLDGDVYGSPRERRERVKSAITGDQAMHVEQRRELMRLVSKLVPAKNAQGQPLSPEQMLHRLVCQLNPQVVPHHLLEIHGIALGVVNAPDPHALVNQIIDQTGEPRELALGHIVELASLSDQWPHYIRLVRYWLQMQKTELNL